MKSARIVRDSAYTFGRHRFRLLRIALPRGGDASEP
ncbi:MAG: hypothetical protein K0Q72_4870, partial [Armatimonadetes bacterium]|nr:hypothetical protein [Armatimonadota bacterium]